jgi:hypothetical protein
MPLSEGDQQIADLVAKQRSRLTDAAPFVPQSGLATLFACESPRTGEVSNKRADFCVPGLVHRRDGAAELPVRAGDLRINPDDFDRDHLRCRPASLNGIKAGCFKIVARAFW